MENNVFAWITAFLIIALGLNNLQLKPKSIKAHNVTIVEKTRNETSIR